MSGPNYRTAFIATLLLAAVLAAGLIYFWRQSAQKQYATPTSEPSASASAPAETMSPTNASGVVPAQPWLAGVQLSPQRLQSIGVKFAQVQRKAIRDSLRVSGNVDVDEERLAYVQTRFPGWIQKVYADATFDYVHKGQPLFTIYSQDLVSTEQEFLLALKNKQALSTTAASDAAQQADWLVQAARQRLQQWGVPEAQIDALARSGKLQREITVESPVSGYVIERNALPNQFVQPETKLYTIADLSHVRVNAQVFQSDVGRLRTGDPATVTVDAYPGRVFRGRVHQILPQVDASTRTVRVRLIFQNPGLLLKPGMYVNVALGVPLGTQLVVPASGVLQSGTRQIAFIDHGNGQLEPREIKTGLRAGDDFVVLRGLRAGERVVSSANFLIDSEAQLQSALGQFAPPSPEAQAAGAKAATQAANVEFTTEPSPPHKGANTFRIKLTDSSGKPITGAQVTVTFFMPAMPAMEMAAMKVTATLMDRGNGLYEGKATLGSGGTWQVGISAQQNGRTIASKQMNISATGGM